MCHVIRSTTDTGISLNTTSAKKNRKQLSSKNIVKTSDVRNEKCFRFEGLSKMSSKMLSQHRRCTILRLFLVKACECSPSMGKEKIRTQYSYFCRCTPSKFDRFYFLLSSFKKADSQVNLSVENVSGLVDSSLRTGNGFETDTVSFFKITVSPNGHHMESRVVYIDREVISPNTRLMHAFLKESRINSSNHYLKNSCR